jgi:hypothetical protein
MVFGDLSCDHDNFPCVAWRVVTLVRYLGVARRLGLVLVTDLALSFGVEGVEFP